MPLQHGVQRSVGSPRVATVSRRVAVRAALGTWLCAGCAAAPVQVRAQAEAATPSAGQTAQPESGLTVPAGIRLAVDAAPATGPPVSGGELRLVRPGEILE